MLRIEEFEEARKSPFRQAVLSGDFVQITIDGTFLCLTERTQSAALADALAAGGLGSIQTEENNDPTHLTGTAPYVRSKIDYDREFSVQLRKHYWQHETGILMRAFLSSMLPWDSVTNASQLEAIYQLRKYLVGESQSDELTEKEMATNDERSEERTEMDNGGGLYAIPGPDPRLLFDEHTREKIDDCIDFIHLCGIEPFLPRSVEQLMEDLAHTLDIPMEYEILNYVFSTDAHEYLKRRVTDWYLAHPDAST